MQPVLQALNARQQFVAIDRADEIVVGAEIEPLGQAGQLAGVGDQQDRQLPGRLGGAPLRDQAQRVAIRHRQAGDDQLDRRVERALCFGAVRNPTHRGGDWHQCLEDPPGGRIVFFEQQDACALAIVGKRGLVLAVAELAADLFAQPQLFHHPL